MGVVVNRDAIRIEPYHLLERRVETVDRLVRQAVDQIEIDRAHAAEPRFLDDCDSDLDALHAIYRFLHARIEILDPGTDTVEAQIVQVSHIAFLHDPRIDLDRKLAVLGCAEPEVPRGYRHQRLRLLPGQKSRRAAAPVQLPNFAIPVEEFSL